jgi:hypothetical protein
VGYDLHRFAERCAYRDRQYDQLSILLPEAPASSPDSVGTAVLLFSSAGSALRDDGLIQIPITPQTWFAGATERIAVRTTRTGAPREIAREKDHEGDCESDDITE